MLNKSEAAKELISEFPNFKIVKGIEYIDNYIFVVENSEDDLESGMDSFYSVDKFTGKVKEFSVITDGDISELARLFENEGEQEAH